VAEPSM